MSMMTGTELHQLLLDKWDYSYDLQLRRYQDKICLQVMWKYLEQVSFSMTEAEYEAHLAQVADYLTALGAVDQVRDYVTKTREKPRIGKAVTIVLDVDLGGRASEWMLEL
jgi:nanoRNase/pAp phosphatase (c-di-AMP/oligoRNAs hydrolase)